jgi:hypothetical protein
VKVKALRKYRPISFKRGQDPLLPGDVVELDGKALKLALGGKSVEQFSAPKGAAKKGAAKGKAAAAK